MSGNQVFRPWGRAAPGVDQKVDGIEVRAPTPLGEESSRIHGGQLLGNRRCHELIKLVPSALAHRTTSALTDVGRRSG